MASFGWALYLPPRLSAHPGQAQAVSRKLFCENYIKQAILPKS
jgi:hypothetical protein